MSQTPVLLESSFADAIAIIAASDELPKQTRRHWTTSLRQIAKALDKPLEVIPARLTAVRAELAQLHHAPTGLTAQDAAESQEQREERPAVAGAGKPHSQARGVTDARMEELRAQIRDRFVRWRLSAFMRFCSASGIAPAEVDEVVLERFLRYRAQSGTVSGDASGRRPGPNLEFEYRKYPGLADAPAEGAGGEAHDGAALDAVSRGPSPGC